MKYNYLLALVVLTVAYTGCSKQGEIVTPIADTKPAAASTGRNIVSQKFAVNDICGTYIISGRAVSYASGGDGDYSFNNDTIVIAQCSDSSVSYRAISSNNSYFAGQNLCCNYPGSSPFYQFPKNYLFAGSEGITRVVMYFPPLHLDSLYLNVNSDRACDGYDMYLTGIKLRQ